MTKRKIHNNDSRIALDTIRLCVKKTALDYFKKEACSFPFSEEDLDDLFQDILVYILENHIDTMSNIIETVVQRETNQRCEILNNHHKNRAHSSPNNQDEIVNSAEVITRNMIPSAHEVLIQEEKARYVRELIRDMPENERAMIILKYFEQFSNKHICEILAIDDKSAQRRLASARKEVRKRGMKEYRYVFDDEITITTTLMSTNNIPKPLTEVVHVISIELIKYLKEHPRALYDIKPRQFEELVAEILASYGWEVQLTPETKDGGYDILAISKELQSGLRTSWIIECKKYAPENKVGVDIVRSLYGIKSDKKVANALLATTSYFTKGVKDFKTSRYDIELKDYQDILEWINEYRPNPNGRLYLKNNQLILPKEV